MYSQMVRIRIIENCQEGCKNNRSLFTEQEQRNGRKIKKIIIIFKLVW